MARWQAAKLHHGRTYQFRRLELNQHPPVFSGTLDLRAAPENSRASGGSRTHTLRFTRTVLSLLSFAGIEQGDRWELNPRNLVHSQAPEAPRVRPQYPRQESNLHDLRLRRAACLRHTPGIWILRLAFAPNHRTVPQYLQNAKLHQWLRWDLNPQHLSF